MSMKRGRKSSMKRGRIIDDLKVLPPEIITEILSRLPADSAIGCRRVCKSWRSLIDDPAFVDNHTGQLISSSSYNHKKFGGNYFIPNSGFFLCAQRNISSSNSLRLRFIEYNDDEKRLVPEFKLSNKPIYDHTFPLYNKNWDTLLSCNGLVFMGGTRPTDMFVCNPFTREYMNLPTPTPTSNDRFRFGAMACGFGYLPSTNEYKVVCIYFSDCFFEPKGHVSVYTLGSGIGWRNKGEIPYSLLRRQPGLLANGAIHWFMYENGDKKKIVSFDLADEEFRVVVPLPPPPSPGYIDKLGVLGGCLCVIRDYKERCKGTPEDVWILNVNNKEEEEEFSWDKKFSIGCTWRKPCAVLKSGKILLGGGIVITTYDPKTEAFYEADRRHFPDSQVICMIIPYNKSFLSLKALGEEDAKCFGGFLGHALAQQ